MAVAAVAGLVIVYITVTLRQRTSPPGCTGIGFGCEPDPGGSVFLWGVFALLPATAITIGLLLLTLLGPTESLRRKLAYGVAGVYAVAAILAPLILPE